MATPPSRPPDLDGPLRPPRPESPSALKGILITEEELRDRIQQLAEDINRVYREESVVVVGVLSGSILFFADLIRQIRSPLEIDFVGISSYRTGTTAGRLETTKPVTTELKGRRVLVVDDILDGGNTLTAVKNTLRPLQASEIRCCVLLERSDRRVQPVQADFVGFRIPDYFVVGYGLDYGEKYRNLPYVGVLDESLLSSTRDT